MSSGIIRCENLEALQDLLNKEIQTEIEKHRHRFHVGDGKLADKGILGIQPIYSITHFRSLSLGGVTIEQGPQLYETTGITWKVCRKGPGGIIYKSLGEALDYLEAVVVKMG